MILDLCVNKCRFSKLNSKGDLITQFSLGKILTPLKRVFGVYKIRGYDNLLFQRDFVICIFQVVNMYDNKKI